MSCEVKNLTRSNFGLYELCAFNQNDVKKIKLTMNNRIHVFQSL